MFEFYYKVFCFYITKQPDHFHGFHIGVFDSKERAEKVVETIKEKPGFCDHQDKIKIRKIIRFKKPDLLNNIYWTEGFEACSYDK